MFFVGWLASDAGSMRIGPAGGAVWGGGFFILTAVRMCPGPRARFTNWLHPKRARRS
jgi:hypothetical protein